METQLLPTIFLPFPATFIASKHGPTFPSPYAHMHVPSFVDSIPLTGCLSGHVLSVSYVPSLLGLHIQTRKTQTVSSVAHK